MKKSEMIRNPEAIARERIWAAFNVSVNNVERRRCTVFRRFGNPESARLALTGSMWTKVLAWHQDGNKLTALYSYRGCYVLFDNYFQEEIDGIDVVMGVIAKTPNELSEVLSILEKSQLDPFHQPTLFGSLDE